MADLTTIALGVNEQKRTDDLNSNFAEIETRKADKATNGYATLDSNSKVNQTAKTADTAKDYDAATGTIKIALDGIAGDIEDIEDGTTVVGKAKALQPDSSPGNTKYYGTDEFGNIGWHDYTSGSEDPTGQTAVAFVSGTGWTESGSRYTLTLPHGNKYPGDVYKEVSGNHDRVVVGITRTSTNVIITSDAPFTGYLLLS